MTPLRRSISVGLALGVLVLVAWPVSPYSRVNRALASEKVAAIEPSDRIAVHRAAVGNGCASCHAHEMSVSGGACREPGPMLKLMLVE